MKNNDTENTCHTSGDKNSCKKILRATKLRQSERQNRRDKQFECWILHEKRSDYKSVRQARVGGKLKQLLLKQLEDRPDERRMFFRSFFRLPKIGDITEAFDCLSLKLYRHSLVPLQRRDENTDQLFHIK